MTTPNHSNPGETVNPLLAELITDDSVAHIMYGQFFNDPELNIPGNGHHVVSRINASPDNLSFNMGAWVSALKTCI
jgi:hypothetical protein